MFVQISIMGTNEPYQKLYIGIYIVYITDKNTYKN